MLIVHIVHSYFPRVGGIERAVQCLAESQARLGNEVVVLTSDVRLAGLAKRELVNGVEVVRLCSKKLLYNDLTVPLERPGVRRADIVHAHSQNSLFSVVLSKLLKKRLRAKVAFHFMAVDAFGNHPNPAIRLLAPHYGRMNLREALKVADLPIVRSRRDQEILKRKYDVEAEYLPDAVPERYFTLEKKDPQGFMEKYGIRQVKFFLFIGRIHELKGPHVLVEALKHLDPHIAVVLIGPDDGFLKETLRLAERIGVRSRVHYLGYVSEEDKIWAIDSAVALVLPSIADHVEVYSIAISEAWARGKPVIASSVGELPYRISHGVNGLLVKPSDPIALAEAMARLASDRELAAKMGEQGRTAVSTWDDVARESLELYERTLGL